MKAWSKGLAIASLVLAGLAFLQELPWLARSGVAKVILALAVAVGLLAAALLLDQAARKDAGDE